MGNSNGKIFGVAAVAIAIVALFFSFQSSPAPVADDRDVGGERAGVQNFSDGATLGQETERWYAQKLPVGSEEVLMFRNTFGKDVYAYYGESDVITGETASSSYKVYLFATTSPSIAAWANVTTAVVTTGKSSLINGVTLATSTTATTTSSTYALDSGKGNGTVLVPDGSYFFGFIQAVDLMACADTACEPATSTARGFDPLFKVKIHY